MAETPPQLESIRSTLRGQLDRLSAEYHVSSLEVFGSYVRGEASTASDLDLLVEFTTPPSLFRFVELEDELTQLLGMKVDLVMREGLKPALGARILAESVPV